MAFASFQEYRFRIDWEIAENHAILVNLTASIGVYGTRADHHTAEAYTRRQINLYRMFFADFSVNSQLIVMKFCMDYLRVTRRIPWDFHQKILYS